MTDRSALTIIRASSLSSWPDCPRRGAARTFAKEILAAGYELNPPQPSGIAAAIGTAVHKGAQVMLSEKAKSGELPPDSVSADAAVEAIREQVREGVAYDGTTASLNDAEKQVRRMQHTYRVDVAPKIEPIMVEERLEAEIAPGVILSGQADTVARSPGKIHDTKTGVRLSAHNPQLGSYSLLARTHGYDIREAGIDFIKRSSMKKPQEAAISTTHEIAKVESAATNILRMIQTDLATFREGDPARNVLPGDAWSFAANPMSVLCGEKYCPAYGRRGQHAFCQEWRKDDSVPGGGP